MQPVANVVRGALTYSDTLPSGGSMTLSAIREVSEIMRASKGLQLSGKSTWPWQFAHLQVVKLDNYRSALSHLSQRRFMADPEIIG